MIKNLVIIFLLVTSIILTLFLVIRRNNSNDDQLLIINLAEMDKRHEYTGKNVTIFGTASNAKEGATVREKFGFVIVDGIDEWPDVIYGKDIVITGYLSKTIWPDTKQMAAVPKGTQYHIDIKSISLLSKRTDKPSPPSDNTPLDDEGK